MRHGDTKVQVVPRCPTGEAAIDVDFRLGREERLCECLRYAVFGAIDGIFREPTSRGAENVVNAAVLDRASFHTKSAVFAHNEALSWAETRVASSSLRPRI